MARTKKIETAPVETNEANPPVTPVIIAYKGFNTNLACRGFQYEIGKTYTHDGDVEACSSGFHACEHPLNVFEYYAPATSRFAIVELGGKTHRDGSDTKIAAAQITIKAEIRIPELVAAAVKYVFDRATWSEKDKATGTQGAASATGTQGAASATGYQGAASATGEQSAAMASGIGGMASGIEGTALFLAERIDSYGADDHGKIIAVWAGIVGRDGIKPNVFYTLRNGKPVEVA